MAWARRDFLRLSTVVIATGVSAACTTEVGGSPKPGAAPSRSADPDSPDSSDSTGEPAAGMRVAVFADSEPESYEDESGELTGQVPEVTREVLRRMGFDEVEFETITEPAQGITMLVAGEVDMIGGLAIQPDLCRNVAFSRPDHVLRSALLVPAGNPKGLKTFTEIVATGARVAVVPSTGRADAERAGVAASQIVELDYPMLEQALVTGTVDCAVFLEVALRRLAEESAGQVEVTEPFTVPGAVPLAVAFAFPPDSGDVEEFNEYLRELQRDGEWLRISGRFGFAEGDLPADDLTADAICAS